MKQYQVEIVNVAEPVFTKTQKGGYNHVEVAFKRDGKIGGKKVMNFVNAEVYAFVTKEAKSGMQVLVTEDKNDAGYLEWTNIEIAPDAPTVVAITAAEHKAYQQETPSPRKPGGRVIGNTYETPEERAVKQAVICRQASINSAIEYLKAQEVPVTVDAVKMVARTFEAFYQDDLAKAAHNYRTIVKQI